VGNPSVLILDEPTIGLDPKQIIEIRNLIKELGKKHTVILSSHILPEVQAVCERVVIINRGRIAAVDTPISLSARMSKVTKMQMTAEGPHKDVIQKLRTIPGLKKAELVMEKDGTCIVNIESESSVDIRKPLFFEMARNAWPIMELRSLDPTLEDIFLAVTSGLVSDLEQEEGA
jgi:ABC-2 type transport system ATP-binding protein